MERRNTGASESGTETTFRGKRRVTIAAGRLGTGFDDGYRRLDPLPLPDRVQGRRIVVSPKTDNDKGERA